MFVSIFLRGAARTALWLGFVVLLAGASWAQDATPPDTQASTPAPQASAPATQSNTPAPPPATHCTAIQRAQLDAVSAGTGTSA
jgi:hypothetical protein